MPTLRVSKYLLLLLAAAAVPASAQSTTDPATLMTWDDGASCRINTGNNIDQVGCCGAPGRRECAYVVNWFKGGLSDPSPGCVNPDQNQLRLDPYESVKVVRCNLPPPSNAGLVPAVLFPSSSPNFTFYFTSDLHFVESPVDVRASANFPSQMNLFASLQFHWPGGTGIPAGDIIAPPVAVVMGGDITSGGGIDELGDFRLVWETPNNPAAIGYPIMPGLGNHDIANAGTGGAGASSSAHRMWDYLGQAINSVNMDRSSSGTPGLDDGQGSHNYSWDWQGVHFVQLNCWAAYPGNYYAPTSNGLNWLRLDLQQNVGSSNRPVVLIQHFDLLSIGDGRGAQLYDPLRNDFWQEWWTLDNYNQFWNVIRDYNVIGLFDGHEHKMQVNRPEHYGQMATLSPDGKNLQISGAGLPLPVDSRGNPKIFDEFKNATGGWCQTYSTITVLGQNFQGNCIDAKATFYAARVTGSYLDVAAVVWHSGTELFPDLGEPADRSNPDYSKRSPGFWGGTAACRKRIGSQYVPVSAQAQYAAYSAPAGVTCAGSIGSATSYQGFGSQLTGQSSCIAVKNTSNFTLKGPIAVRVTNGSEGSGGGLGALDNLVSRSFVDSCDQWYGDAYVIVSDGDLPPNGTASASIQFEKQSETVNLSLVEVLPLGVVPIVLDQTLIQNFSSSPPPRSVRVLAPGAKSFHSSVGYNTSVAGWLTVTDSPLASDGTGSLTLTYDASVLSAHLGVFDANVTVTSDSGSSAVLKIRMVLSKPLTATPATLSFTSGSTQVLIAAQDNSNIPFTASDGANYTVSPNSATTPATITLIANSELKPGDFDDPLTIKWGNVNEIKVPVSLQVETSSVSSAPSGQPFDVDGVTHSSATRFTWIAGQSHELKIQGPFATAPGSELVFGSWSDGGAQAHLITAPAFGSPANYVARFNPFFQLNLASDPAGVTGQVSAAPLAAQPGNYYAANTPVTVTATPNSGAFFAGFSGDLSGAANPQPLTVSKPMNVTALFEPNSLAGSTTVATIPANQQVLVDSVPVLTPAVYHWTPSQTHTISVPLAVTSPGARYGFGGWTDGNQSATRQVTGIAVGNQNFTANLTQQFQVSATFAPSASGTISGDGWFNQGATATLTATPAPGFQFTQFEGPLTSVSNPLVLRVDQPLNLQADMAPSKNPQLYATAGARAAFDPAQPDLQSLVITLANAGPGPAGDAVITGIDGFKTLSGTGTASVFGLNPFPAAVSTLLPNQSGSVVVGLFWPTTLARLQATVHFSANQGTYNGSTTINIFH